VRVTIRDPQGFVHVLEFDSQRWHGYDNIAHGWEPSARPAVIEHVLVAIQFQRQLPWGFTYAP
jgi:hypothetical protein